MLARERGLRSNTCIRIFSSDLRTWLPPYSSPRRSPDSCSSPRNLLAAGYCTGTSPATAPAVIPIMPTPWDQVSMRRSGGIGCAVTVHEVFTCARGCPLSELGGIGLAAPCAAHAQLQACSITLLHGNHLLGGLRQDDAAGSLA
jgi:hypothetical protein